MKGMTMHKCGEGSMGGALGHSLGVTDWSKGKWDGGWKQLLSGVQIELGRGYWTGPCRGGKGDTGVRTEQYWGEDC